MFDRFTNRAKKCMSLARKASLAWNHEYIGTEHLLLGLLDEGTSVACNVLRSLQVDAARLRAVVEARVNRGPHALTMDQLPFTPRAKKVLELAMEEASEFGHSYIGTEHLLLGLLGEAKGIAALALQECGVDLAATRAEVLEFIGESSERLGQLRGAGPEPMLGARGSAAANPTASTEHEPVGTVRLVYAAEWTPGEGWLPCDGRRIARAEHPELFALVGERFGGDAQHFQLPDFRGLQPGHRPGPTRVFRSLRFAPLSGATSASDPIEFWIKAR